MVNAQPIPAYVSHNLLWPISLRKLSNVDHLLESHVWSDSFNDQPFDTTLVISFWLSHSQWWSLLWCLIGDHPFDTTMLIFWLSHSQWWSLLWCQIGDHPLVPLVISTFSRPDDHLFGAIFGDIPHSATTVVAYCRFQTCSLVCRKCK